MVATENEVPLLPFPDEWGSALVIVAHPDDIEYGIAPAVARWVSEGRQVSYLLATRGEAGIAGTPPWQAGPLREAEELASAAVVGVDTVDFLDQPDGRLQEGLELRREIARVIRIRRPELVVTLNFDETWAHGHLNSSDHRALGRSVLDAVADAANEWIFPELAAQGHDSWSGVKWIAVAAPRCSHVVTVAGFVEPAIRSLAAHRGYLEALSDDPVEVQARRQVEMVTRPKRGYEGTPCVGFTLFDCGGGL